MNFRAPFQAKVKSNNYIPLPKLQEGKQEKGNIGFGKRK